LFGIFFIYPLIRTQIREEGKLRAMTATLSARSETLQHAALTDPLTGMQNRRYFDDALREYIEEFRRIDRPIGLMILDLDHFKDVNDTHGHDVGDEVLRAVASCLRDMTRYHDIVARLGGEEFAVVAPNMNEDLLVKFAERIRKAVASMAVQSGNVRLKVTTSVGLAVWDSRESGEEFYRRADRLLYQAKRMGRNRVCARSDTAADIVRSFMTRCTKIRLTCPAIRPYCARHEKGIHPRSRQARGQGGVTAGRVPPMRDTQAPSGAFFIGRNRTKRPADRQQAKDTGQFDEQPTGRNRTARDDGRRNGGAGAERQWRQAYFRLSGWRGPPDL
jgi:diguanylate cyclase (GGDEF)-like protein